MAFKMGKFNPGEGTGMGSALKKNSDRVKYAKENTESTTYKEEGTPRVPAYKKTKSVYKKNGEPQADQWNKELSKLVAKRDRIKGAKISVARKKRLKNIQDKINAIYKEKNIKPKETKKEDGSDTVEGTQNVEDVKVDEGKDPRNKTPEEWEEEDKRAQEEIKKLEEKNRERYERIEKSGK